MTPTKPNQTPQPATLSQSDHRLQLQEDLDNAEILKFQSMLSDKPVNKSILKSKMLNKAQIGSLKEEIVIQDVKSRARVKVKDEVGEKIESGSGLNEGISKATRLTNLKVLPSPSSETELTYSQIIHNKNKTPPPSQAITHTILQTPRYNDDDANDNEVIVNQLLHKYRRIRNGLTIERSNHELTRRDIAETTRKIETCELIGSQKLEVLNDVRSKQDANMTRWKMIEKIHRRKTIEYTGDVNELQTEAGNLEKTVAREIVLNDKEVKLCEVLEDAVVKVEWEIRENVRNLNKLTSEHHALKTLHSTLSTTYTSTFTNASNIERKLTNVLEELGNAELDVLMLKRKSEECERKGNLWRGRCELVEKDLRRAEGLVFGDDGLMIDSKRNDGSRSVKEEDDSSALMNALKGVTAGNKNNLTPLQTLDYKYVNGMKVSDYDTAEIMSVSHNRRGTARDRSLVRAPGLWMNE